MGQSRAVIFVVVLLLSVVLPAAICGAVLLAPAATSWLELAAVGLACAAWMALLVLVNWWEFTSIGLRWAWALALGACLAWKAAIAGQMLPSIGSSIGVGTAVSLAFALAGLWLVAKALSARGHDGAAVELACFPLANGRFLVTDGGDGARSFLVNYHYGFGRHRAGGVSASMRYAMDVVEVNAAGTEAHGYLPARNEAYRIWRHPLRAPCDGEVVHAVNGVADNSAFGPHRPYGVGNQVVIRAAATEDLYVVLGHMEHGSVEVQVGQRVRAGDPIGRVGNSGWTERPHLHMQAMRSADGDWWHGAPVPVRFGGRFLVRNQVVREGARGAGGAAPAATLDAR